MIEWIRRMFRKQKAPNGDARLRLDFAEKLVHELYAPLVGASVGLDLLCREKLSSRQQAATTGIRAALNESKAILESFRVIRLMGRGIAVKRERVPLGQVVQVIERVITDLKYQYSGRKIRVAFEKPSLAQRIDLDLHLLRVAVWEIVKNTYQYSFAKSIVTVEVGIVGNSLCIKCKNMGLAIDLNDIDSCVQPGWRSPKAAATAPVGRGFGLWLAKKIVELHGGKIMIGSSESLTSVGLIFPLGVNP